MQRELQLEWKEINGVLSEYTKGQWTCDFVAKSRLEKLIRKNVRLTVRPKHYAILPFRALE